MSFSSTLRNRDNKYISFIYFSLYSPGMDKLDQSGPNRPKWTEIDQIEPNELTWAEWTNMGVYYLYLLKLMKMTYGSLSRRENRPFNLTMNTTLAYKYEYNGGIWFFLYKLKINKNVIFFPLITRCDPILL